MTTKHQKYTLVRCAVCANKRKILTLRVNDDINVVFYTRVNGIIHTEVELLLCTKHWACLAAYRNIPVNTLEYYNSLVPDKHKINSDEQISIDSFNDSFGYEVLKNFETKKEKEEI